MTPEQEQWYALVARLAAAWPRFEIGRETLREYVGGLSDLSYDEVARAVDEAIRTMKYPPTIAELREVVGRGRYGYPDASFAVAVLDRALATKEVAERRTILADLPGPGKLALEQIGGFYGWRTSEQPDRMRYEFTKLYDEHCRREVRAVMVGAAAPPLLRSIEGGEA